MIRKTEQKKHAEPETKRPDWFLCTGPFEKQTYPDNEILEKKEGKQNLSFKVGGGV